MLVISRTPGAGCSIRPHESLPAETPIGLFTWPIDVFVLHVGDDHARLGIDADPQFRILPDQVRQRCSSLAPAPADDARALGLLLATATNVLERALRRAPPHLTRNAHRQLHDLYTRLSLLSLELPPFASTYPARPHSAPSAKHNNP